MIAFSSSPELVKHDTGPHHPERPDRIRAIYRAMFDAGLIARDPFPDFRLDTGLAPLSKPALLELTPVRANEKWLQLCHPPEYIERIKRICTAGGGVLDQGDTPVCPASHDIALLSLGCALAGADAVMTGNARRAFSAGRPPGHHAEPQQAMGFCLYSNAAIVARYLQRQFNVERVAIVDFDVHHGNGTQACLEDDSSIYFISLHQHPATCYPGTGHGWEIGVGPARGYTLNLPFDPGAEDMDYLRVIDTRVIPELEDFRPEVLVISAGFDAHRDDPLASINLSDDCFELMTRSLCALADQYCLGRVISLLEGGYNLRALGRSAVRHVAGMM